MYKMLIVEDERWEREGLVDFLDWKSLGIEVAGTACDGIEGLEQALKIRPPIIITDIKMPGMDGITMSKKIKELLPEVKIIISTGYDDFRFAKEAISFNANGYVLKPLEEEEMLQVMQKVVGMCDKERERLEEENSIRAQLNENLGITRRKFLEDLLEGKIDGEELQKKLRGFDIEASMEDKPTVIVLKRANSDVSKPDSPHSRFHEIAESVESVLEKACDAKGSKLLFSLYEERGNEFVLCTRSAVDENELFLSMLNEAIQKAGAGHGIQAVTGIGNAADSIGSLHQSYEEARKAVMYGTFWEEFGPISFRDVDSIQRSFSHSASEFLIQGNYFPKQLIHAIRSLEEDKAFELAKETFEYIRSNKGASRELIVNYLQSVINEISLCVYAQNKDFEQANVEENLLYRDWEGPISLSSIEEGFIDFCRKAVEGICEKKSRKDEQLLKKVIALIDEGYMRDICLKGIAGEVFLSPNYLGSIFKKHTGKSFNDYLCEYRMEKAKELLKSPKSKVNLVAAKVGIPNVSYFCTIFKNTYSMAPGQYQEMIRRNQ